MTLPDHLKPPEGDNDMTPEQAAEHLRVIRELMERPIRSTTRSGLSGVIAGVFALAGCAATWQMAGPAPEPTPAVGLLWLGVFVSAVVADLLLTWYRARRTGQTYWRRSQRQTALAIAPGFLVGGLLTWLLLKAGDHPSVPFFWMIFYGMAVWSVGLFSVPEVKLLGAAFLAAGIVGLFFFQGWPLAAMAVTFGGLHLAYGIRVWTRYGG